MLTVTATDLPRIMQCNGSIDMVKTTLPNVNSDMTVRDEGNAVHWVINSGLRKEFSPLELVDRKAPNGVFITSEMSEYVDWYFENLPSVKDCAVECDTSFAISTQAQVSGRGDYCWFDERTETLHVCDFKYGWRPVSPEMNWTLIAHAIGYTRQNNIYPSNVKFTIYQPRPYHPLGTIREWKISFQQLVDLSVVIEHTFATLKNELQTGEHCLHCPSLANCPAASIAAMNSIDVSETIFDDQIDSQSLSYTIDQLRYAKKTIDNKLKAFEELATHRLQKGEIVQNYSLKTALSNKQWKSGTTPEMMQMLTGLDLTKKALVTPTQALKLGVSEIVVNSMAERVQTGFNLEKIDANAKAQLMFNTKGNE